MTVDHLQAVLEAYAEYLRMHNHAPVRMDSTLWPDDKWAVLNHCMWMCVEAINFVDNANGDEEQVYKAKGWLGFVQGCLWFSRQFTVDQLREHSRSPERGGKLPVFSGERYGK